MVTSTKAKKHQSNVLSVHTQEAILKSGAKTTSRKTLSGGEGMTEVGEVYICEICGNKVKVLESGVGTLVCCGEPMKLVESD